MEMGKMFKNRTCQFPPPFHLHLPKHLTYIPEYLAKKVEQSSLEVIGHSVFVVLLPMWAGRSSQTDVVKQAQKLHVNKVNNK